MTADIIKAKRTPLQRAFTYLRSRPQSWISAMLFVLGWAALKDDITALAGAFFGSGAAMLGAWITDENIRRSAAEDKMQKQRDAQQYLTPELYRTIERILYIHGRAVANFTSASANTGVKPNDIKQDFIPFWPVLYPNAPQFRDLSGEEAGALISYYDSLHSVSDVVDAWWGREDQLPTNIFLSFLEKSSESLRLALECVGKFDMDKRFPPRYSAWASISSRIRSSLDHEDDARAHHLVRAEAKQGRAK